MRLAKVRTHDGQIAVGVVEEEHVQLLDLGPQTGFPSLTDLLADDDPEAAAAALLAASTRRQPFEEVTFLAPIDQQEVWAAGVTYLRSRQARRDESQSAGSFYDLVYTADRPELFFKATPHRVAGPGGNVRIRQDAHWNVPEPELALVVSPRGRLAGFTIGNDMSARDIEGANPLYLPQAKVYDACCALGPVITLADQMPPPEQTTIAMQVRRAGAVVFDGSTSLANMRRSYRELIDWLTRDNSFPNGVILLTGTGIVPPDAFSLQPGDEISISITGIGTLTNNVECKSSSG